MPFRREHLARSATLILILGGMGCRGAILEASGDTSGTGGTGGGGDGPIPGVVGLGNGGAGGSGGMMAEPRPAPLPGPPIRSAGARRLTREELARSLRRLLGADVPVDVRLLPGETLTPFDNDVVEQSPSMLLVESMETIGRDVAAFVTASPERPACQVARSWASARRTPARGWRPW
jgi:hypothetical protein